MSKVLGRKIITEEGTVFPERGYTVFRIGLTKDTIRSLKKLAKEQEMNPIFNQEVAQSSILVPTKNDRKRLMSSVLSPTFINTNTALRLMWKELEVTARLHNRGWHPFKLVVLRSMKGCLKQATHNDGTDQQSAIGGIIIAVQDKTFFQVNETLLELRAGEAVAFHGTTPHGGAAYAKDNVRYHCFMARTIEDIPSDEVGKYERVCDACNRGFDSYKQKKEHSCSAKKQDPEKKEKRRQLNLANKRNQRKREEEETEREENKRNRRKKRKARK
jgi:hypothetical protein